MDRTFSAIFIDLLEENHMSVAKASRFCSIPVDTLHAYKKARIVPSKKNAIIILKKFGLEMNEDEIDKMLEYSREAIRSIKEDDEVVERNIVIRRKYFEDITDGNLEDIIKIINRRIMEIFKEEEIYSKYGSASINSYLNYLIYEDIKEMTKGDN